MNDRQPGTDDSQFMNTNNRDTFNHTDFEREQIRQLPAIREPDPPQWLTIGRDAEGRYVGSPQTYSEQELHGETQESIGQWAVETFPGGDDQSPTHALRLLDEVLELCLVAGVSLQQLHDSVHKVTDAYDEWEEGEDDECWPDPAAVPAEAADVAITLAVLCHRRKIDLKREVDRKMIVNRARKWRSNGDGTGQHIREEQGS